jgi:uncharacterized Zn-binding protein involved in type VI secretion
MPAVSRKDGTDKIVTGHPCTPVTVTLQGSSNVFANNIGVVRLTDKLKPHTFGPTYHKGRPNCNVVHTLPLTKASQTVFANNRGVGRIGDRYVRETLITGSPNVFAGG